MLDAASSMAVQLLSWLAADANRAGGLGSREDGRAPGRHGQRVARGSSGQEIHVVAGRKLHPVRRRGEVLEEDELARAESPALHEQPRW